MRKILLALVVLSLCAVNVLATENEEVQGDAPVGSQVVIQGAETTVNITVYEDSGFDAMRFSLDNLGLSYSYHDGDDSGFVADLASGTFGLAVINQSNYSRLNDDLDSIHDFVLGGGKLIIANNQYDRAPSHPLWETMGAAWQADLDSPVNPLVRRVPAHPIFNLPHTVPDLVPTHNAGDNGDYMSALAAATTVAGAPGADPLQSLIIVRDGNQAILNSFIPWDYQLSDSDNDLILDVLELFENQITFVLGGGEPCEPTVDVLMPLPNFSSTFSSSSLTRGYWFQAPTDFVISGLRVPDETGNGRQNVEVVRFNNQTPPPSSPGTNAFVSLARFVNQPSSNILSVNIAVSAGDVIGILGAAGTSTMYNSYGQSGDFATEIGGHPVTLTRMGMQHNLYTNPAHDIWQSPGGSIGRVEMWYLAELLPPLPPPEPNNPAPFDGATDVPVETNLMWEWELQPLTITFDELPDGTVVDGMVIEDVTFGFSSDATIDGGPGNTVYVQLPNIEGDIEGTLTLDFAVPVFGVSYGFVLSTDSSQPNATTMTFFDSSMSPIGSFSADAEDMGYSYIEGMNSGTSMTPIARAVITFFLSQPQSMRFALDNLTYTFPMYIRASGGLSAEAGGSEDMDEAESGGHQDANGTDGGYRMWSRPEMAEAGVRIGVESSPKESAPPDESATIIAPLGTGGPDCGDYTFIDSDEPGGPSFDWIEIAAPPPPPPPPGSVPEATLPESVQGTNLDLSDDSHFFPINLPFDFDFYGTSYNQVAVGSNGTIYFEDQYLGLSNVCIPGTTGYGIDRFIALYWDDLYPSWDQNDNVYYAIVGSAPNRILVVQWARVMHCCGPEQGRVTAQVQLFEGTNDILMLYADPSSEAGLGATVGIQNDPTCGLQYLCDQRSLHPNLAILFSRRPPTTWDVYFGTDPNALELIGEDLRKPTCDPTPELNETLLYNMTYYWQVVAKNEYGETQGPRWSFTTERGPNHRPSACILGCNCQRVEGQGPAGAEVTLDGSCSTDPDSNPVFDDINDFNWYEVDCWDPNFWGEADPCALQLADFLGSGEIINHTFPLGEHTIILQVIDKLGASDTEDVTIIVEDTTPPVITLNGPATMTLECGVDSYTEEGATAADICDGNVVPVVIGGDTVDTSTCGTYVVTYNATDASGNMAEQVTRAVIAQDTIPPDFEFSVTPTVLWPVNHNMVLITPSWTASDICDASPEVSLVSITMNEDDDAIGDGHTTGDIRVDPDGSIYLRAERSGPNSGRIYTIVYQAVDDCGNVTVRSATVSIPHDFRVLARISARWLWTGPAGRIQEDLNGDGIVNLADFAKFAENWIK